MMRKARLTSFHDAWTDPSSCSRYQNRLRVSASSDLDAVDRETMNCRSASVGIGAHVCDEGRSRRVRGRTMLVARERGGTSQRCLFMESIERQADLPFRRPWRDQS